MATSQASSSAPTPPKELLATVAGVTYTTHGLRFMNEVVHSYEYARGLLERNWHRLDLCASLIDMAKIVEKDTVLLVMGSALDAGMVAEKLGVDRVKQMVVLNPSKSAGGSCVHEVEKRFDLEPKDVQVVQNTDIRHNAAAGIKKFYWHQEVLRHREVLGGASLFIKRLVEWYLERSERARMVINRAALSDEVNPTMNVMFKPAAMRGIKARSNIGGDDFAKFSNWSSRCSLVPSSLTNLVTNAEVMQERQAFRQVLTASGATVKEMEEGLDRTPIVAEAQRNRTPPNASRHQQIEHERKIRYVEIPVGDGSVQRKGENFTVDEDMRRFMGGKDPAQAFVEHLSHGAKVTW